MHQGCGDLTAAFLTAGQELVPLFQDVLQLEDAADPGQSLLGLRAAGSVKDAPAQQVLPNGEEVVQHVLLVDDADLSADLVVLLAEGVTADGGGAAVRLEQGGEHIDRGGFAGTVDAKKTKHRALFHGEADVIHGGEGAVGFGQVVDFDDVHAVTSMCCAMIIQKELTGNQLFSGKLRFLRGKLQQER